MNQPVSIDRPVRRRQRTILPADGEKELARGELGAGQVDAGQESGQAAGQVGPSIWRDRAIPASHRQRRASPDEETDAHILGEQARAQSALDDRLVFALDDPSEAHRERSQEGVDLVLLGAAQLDQARIVGRDGRIVGKRAVDACRGVEQGEQARGQRGQRRGSGRQAGRG